MTWRHWANLVIGAFCLAMGAGFGVQISQELAVTATALGVALGFPYGQRGYLPSLRQRLSGAPPPKLGGWLSVIVVLSLFVVPRFVDAIGTPAYFIIVGFMALGATSAFYAVLVDWRSRIGRV